MLTNKTDITADTALSLASSAIAHARANSWEVTVAICDSTGNLLAFLRTDNVVIPAIDFALDKAFTAASLRTPTGAFGERMSSHPTLSLGVGTRSRLLTWAGGLPIYSDGVCVGGIGVSGAKDHEDLACAHAALDGLGFSATAS